MKTVLRIVALLLVVVAAIAFFGRSPEAPYPTVQCPVAGDVGREVVCHEVRVPLDRTVEETPEVLLRVAVIKGGARAADDAPLLFLPDLPGLPMIANIAEYARLPILRDRDVVLVDLRGSGFSQPSLDCPEADAALDLSDETGAGQSPERDPYLGALADCRTRLDRDPGSPLAFTTRAHVDDLEAVRAALSRGAGWDRWTPVGAGWGGRLALEVARTHPDGVESVILDSWLPQNIDVVGSRPETYRTALLSLEAVCDADADCGLPFPSVEATAGRVVAGVPTALDPDTDRPLGLGSSDVRLAIHAALQDPDVVPLLPWVLHRLDEGIEDGEIDDEAHAVLDTLVAVPGAESPWRAISEGTYYGVVCTDVMPFTPAESASLAYQATPELVGPRNPVEACDVWGFGRTQTDLLEPFQSDLKALVFTSALDPDAPPAWTRRVADDLPNALVVETATPDRLVGSADCRADIMRSFLGERFRSPDTGCAGDERIQFRSVLIPVPTTGDDGSPWRTGALVLAWVALLAATGIIVMALISERRTAADTGEVDESPILKGWVVVLGSVWLFGALAAVTRQVTTRPGASTSFGLAQPAWALFVFGLPWLAALGGVALLLATATRTRRPADDAATPSHTGLEPARPVPSPALLVAGLAVIAWAAFWVAGWIPWPF